MVQCGSQSLADLRQHTRGALSITVQHQCGSRIQRIEQKVRIQLVTQSAEASLACLGFGPQQAFALLSGPLPLLDAEIEAAPEKKHHRRLNRVSGHVGPIELLEI